LESDVSIDICAHAKDGTMGRNVGVTFFTKETGGDRSATSKKI
jgi:hypothetical protein